MELLIITGFLGSGKTTLLRHIADEFVRKNPERKMAIIENEVGQVGIDGQFLQDSGLLIREINSGCICCSIRIDFITTLLELESTYQPDLVILEPSGVAGPRQLLESLIGYGGNISKKRIMSIVDASRIKYIPDITIPIISDGINVADFTVLNKIDLVTDEQLEETKKKIRSIRQNAEIIEVSAITEINVDRVVDRILAQDYHNSPVIFDAGDDSSAADNATVVAQDVNIELENGETVADAAKRVADVLAEIAAKLKTIGCSMIGHLKTVIKSSETGCIFVSTTSFEHPPHIKGAIMGNPKSLQLTVNAIVYDVDKNELRKIVREEFNRLNSK